MLHKVSNSKGEMPYCFPRSSIKFQGHTGQNITDFDPNWAFSDYRPVAAFKSLRFALLIWEYVLHVEHVSCIITNWGQHWGNHWGLTHLTLPELRSLFFDLSLQILLLQVTRLLSWYSVLSLLYLFTFFWLGCYCSTRSRELVMCQMFFKLM